MPRSEDDLDLQQIKSVANHCILAGAENHAEAGPRIESLEQVKDILLLQKERPRPATRVCGSFARSADCPF